MTSWEDKTVVVTGGAGFIGSHVVEELARRGCRKIKVFDNLCRGNLNNIKHVPHELHTWDLEQAIPNFAQGCAVDAVFHLAAKVTGIEYNRFHHFDMLQRNLAINWHVAEAVRMAGPEVFVNVSTACVYPHDAPVPTPESYGDVCDPEPTNHGYGVAKWVGEQQARYLYDEGYTDRVVIVRFFNSFGVNDYYDEETSHVAPAIIKRVLEGESPIEVWGTGTQTRALVDASDIARALVGLAETEEAGDANPINIGHEREVSIRELAETIVELSGRDVEIVYDTSRPDGYPRRAADTTRLRDLIGYVPDTPLRVTLKNMMADFVERWPDAVVEEVEWQSLAS